MQFKLIFLFASVSKFQSEMPKRKVLQIRFLFAGLVAAILKMIETDIQTRPARSQHKRKVLHLSASTFCVQILHKVAICHSDFLKKQIVTMQDYFL